MTAPDRGNFAGKILAERYQLDRPLGKKVGRQTWLARDRHTEQQVVVKLLLFDASLQWDDFKLFEREAEVLKSLEHPSIHRYLDFFELDETWGKGFALVQSYILAESLEEHLKSGRNFSEADAQEIARSLLQILQYLHDRKPPAIHRDIKPSNILLGDRSGHRLGAVYLVDFGSVQTSIAKQTGTMTIVGSYGYMPPEQFSGRAIPASDLYGLGATLIRLVTGEHPADLPQEDLCVRFERAADLSPEFTCWLQRMVEPIPGRRIASAAEALKMLDNPTTIALKGDTIKNDLERTDRHPSLSFITIVLALLPISVFIVVAVVGGPLAAFLTIASWVLLTLVFAFFLSTLILISNSLYKLYRFLRKKITSI